MYDIHELEKYLDIHYSEFYLSKEYSYPSTSPLKDFFIQEERTLPAKRCEAADFEQDEVSQNYFKQW